jgi:hypothetical protein
MLSGKCDAGEATAPELLDHLQPFSGRCVILLPGSFLDFHAPSISKHRYQM